MPSREAVEIVTGVPTEKLENLKVTSCTIQTRFDYYDWQCFQNLKQVCSRQRCFSVIRKIEYQSLQSNAKCNAVLRTIVAMSVDRAPNAGRLDWDD